jgi:hypothetical protein
VAQGRSLPSVLFEPRRQVCVRPHAFGAVRRPALRRRVGGILVAALLLSASAGCTGGASRRPAAPRAATAVPLSRDSPEPISGPIVPPSEERERPVGALAYLVDSGSGSVYEYDLGRGRFLGPAPRIDLIQKVEMLPGYPTVVGSQPPQGASLTDTELYVAGGLNGTVAAIPIRPDGLGTLRSVRLPPHSVTLEQRYGGAIHSNADTPTGSPFVSFVAATPVAIIAVTSENDYATSVAYSLEPNSLAVGTSRQLSGGAAVDVAPYGDRVVAAMSDGVLSVLRADLTEERSISLGAAPTSVAIVGDEALVGLGKPARLLAIDLNDGSQRTLSTAASSESGPIAVSSHDVWWALPELGKLRHISLATSKQSDSVVCPFITSVLVLRDVVLATCAKDRQLARLSVKSGKVTRAPAGSFPISIVARADESTG